MLKIYGQARSRTFRVLWMAKELGIPYEHVPVSIHGDKPQCKEEWYREINPLGRIPAIEVVGHRMWESAAINIYLARKYGSHLYPKTVEGEGNMLQWAFFVANDIEPAVTAMFVNRVILSPEKRSKDAADEADRALQPRLKVLDDQLAKTACFAGTEWGLADFMVASVLITLQAMKYDLSSYPKLDLWLKASAERPAAKEAQKLRQ